MKYLIYLGAFLTTFLSPIKEVMLIVGVLILIDLIMGIISSIKEKVKITSRKLSKTIIKLLIYELLIITGFITETYLLKSMPLLSITLGFIGVIEFISIGENFTKITGQPFIKFLKEQIFKFNKIKEEKESINIGSTGKMKIN